MKNRRLIIGFLTLLISFLQSCKKEITESYTYKMAGTHYFKGTIVTLDFIPLTGTGTLDTIAAYDTLTIIALNNSTIVRKEHLAQDTLNLFTSDSYTKMLVFKGNYSISNNSYVIYISYDYSKNIIYFDGYGYDLSKPTVYRYNHYSLHTY